MQISLLESLGLVAGAFGTFAAAPQALKIIRTRQARDVSLATYLMAMTGGVLWGIYGFLAGALSIVFWNVVSLMMCSAIIWLKLRHSQAEPVPES
jgi:MtN3 and saliva related transmembrane protein